MAVQSALPRTWNAARVWRWSGNRFFRAFYELLLRARATGVLFDVGANDGTHTYPFAAHGFDCVCFEPQAACGAYIRQTAALNGFERIRLIERAAGETDGQLLTFYTSDSTWYSSFSRENVERFEPADATQVTTITLDSASSQSGLTPTILKIDVEGAEWQVLEGARSVLALRPDVVLEIYRDAPHKRAVWELFERLGYESFTLGLDEQRPFRRIQRLEHFMSFAGSDVAFLPRSSFSASFPVYQPAS